MLLVVLHIYWNLSCISSHNYARLLYLLRERKQTKTIINLLNFIAVVPITVCKEVHGLANTVAIMI